VAETTADASEQCFICLAKRDSAQWVLEADIAGCFDAISHEWLIDNNPMDTQILRKRLKAGFVFKNELFPTVAGTPQDGIISPGLANMCLDGLEQALAKAFPQAKARGL
jgi:RNA-directed DNA polymerase